MKPGKKNEKLKESGEPTPEITSPQPDSDGDAESLARQILIENPEISAATFFNTLKAKGLLAKRATPTEADSASSNAPQLRSGVSKESDTEMTPIHILSSARFLERNAKDDGIGPSKFRAIIIQEGLGNFRDTFYYTKEALQSAVPVFEGKKIYADHPSSQEEETRPERSVRDVLGHFENVRMEQAADGQSMLTADVQILQDPPYAWARALMRHAVEYSKKFTDKEFVGLSINASGDAKLVGLDEFVRENDLPGPIAIKLAKAKEGGVATIKVVTAIKEAMSCDLVTEAGAGGKVMAMIEQEKKIMAKKSKKVKESDQEECRMETSESLETTPMETSPEDSAMDAEHDDAAQDEELFSRLMKKHMGADEELDENDSGLIKEAYEAAKEMGHEAEEAIKMASAYSKLTKHIAGKRAKTEETQPMEKEETKETTTEKETTPIAAKEEGTEIAKTEETKESSEVLVLRGENAKLKETIRATELEKHLDKKLAETGLRREHTKIIRESIGTPKSEKDIERAIETFMLGYKAHGEVGELGFVLNTEKVGMTESNLDLSDCTH